MMAVTAWPFVELATYTTAFPRSPQRSPQRLTEDVSLSAKMLRMGGVGAVNGLRKAASLYCEVQGYIVGTVLKGYLVQGTHAEAKKKALEGQEEPEI
jgi:hypothetical protein